MPFRHSGDRPYYTARRPPCQPREDLQWGSTPPALAQRRSIDYNRVMQIPQTQSRRAEPTRPLLTPRGPVRRWLGTIALFAAVGVVGGWALWYNEQRTLSWSQILDPTYWYHRWRGEDLFD